MAVWRPPERIKVKVIGLAWRQNHLLAAEVETDTGQIKGVRPLGGSVEFGETRERALEREFREELGCGVTITGPWLALENIFQHERAVGHEFVFAANIRLHDATLYDRDEILFAKCNGAKCTARWFLPHNLPKGVALYPDGLAPLLNPPV
jgi:hypothetical protein